MSHPCKTKTKIIFLKQAVFVPGLYPGGQLIWYPCPKFTFTELDWHWKFLQDPFTSHPYTDGQDFFMPFFGTFHFTTSDNLFILFYRFTEQPRRLLMRSVYANKRLKFRYQILFTAFNLLFLVLVLACTIW